MIKNNYTYFTEIYIQNIDLDYYSAYYLAQLIEKQKKIKKLLICNIKCTDEVFKIFINFAKTA